MSIGVCYFPEHWPRERWETDVRQMAEAGIDYVRMAEFSWGRLEPGRDDFDFAWLDEVVDLLGDHGMQAVLCTPTATPPKWLVDERPEIRQVDEDGTVRHWGSRRFTCFNSPAYREESDRIVSTMVDHFAGNPHVAGWQTDNEYGCHDTVLCYCDDCAAAFRDWLRDRYEDVDALNESWGTAFWSQQYPSFDAVDPPRPTPADQHPARELAYQRFQNDAVAEFNRSQVDLLRAADGDWFVTHNGMGDFGALDVDRLADDLDFLSWDSYPTGFAQDRLAATAMPDELRAGDPDQVGMNHDRFRGASGGPFWVMEQQPGDVNWSPHGPQPADGAMRLWAHHAVAHGADSVVYFRWRRCRQGQEQYHAGLRRRDGSADRAYHDASQAAEELADLDLAPVDAPVAVLHDYDSLWATHGHPHAPEWNYWEHERAYYRALRARGVQADLVPPERNLSDYAAVVAPTLYLADDGLADHLSAYVADGGHLLFGARTGQKTPDDQLTASLAPGPLAALAGLRVDRHESVPEQVETRVAYAGDSYDYRTWADWLAPEAAEALGEYETSEAAGAPAVARNAVGDGTVTTCGCWPGVDLADALVTDLLTAAEIPHTERFPDGVRVTERDGYCWVTNFTSEPVSVDAPTGTDWILGGSDVEGFDVAVVEGSAHELELERT